MGQHYIPTVHVNLSINDARYLGMERLVTRYIRGKGSLEGKPRIVAHNFQILKRDSNTLADHLSLSYKVTGLLSNY